MKNFQDGDFFLKKNNYLKMVFEVFLIFNEFLVRKLFYLSDVDNNVDEKGKLIESINFLFEFNNFVLVMDIVVILILFFYY